MPRSCSHFTLVSPRMNHNSSPNTDRVCTFLVVTSGKPAARSKRIWCPKTLRVPVPVRSPFSTPSSRTRRTSSRYCCTGSPYSPRPRRAGSGAGPPRRKCEHGAVTSSSLPTADVSVRVAWAEDAAGIAAVQVAAWREEYAGVLPLEVIDSFDAEEFAATWREAVGRPVDARNRVLVALERTQVCGFAVTTPSPDPDSDPVS